PSLFCPSPTRGSMLYPGGQLSPAANVGGNRTPSIPSTGISGSRITRAAGSSPVTMGCPPEIGPADMIVRGDQIQGGSNGQEKEARRDQAPADGGGARLGQGAVGVRRLPQARGERVHLPPLAAALQRHQAGRLAQGQGAGVRSRPPEGVGR